jgi:hypothetical protein
MRVLSLIFALALIWSGWAHAADNGLGSISGSIRLTGSAPSIPLVYPEQDIDVCGPRARQLQSLVLGTKQAVRDAVVYLGTVGTDGRHSNSNTAVAILDQRDCEFVPRVQIAPSGATLILRNSDPVLHVVRIDMMSGTNAPARLLNVATPYAGYEKTFKLANFREPTLLKAACSNGHGWMVAYLALMPCASAALTDENGQFTLAGVPPGAYKLYAWHEVLGTMVRDVKVTRGRVTSVNLEFGSNRSAAATSTTSKPRNGPSADW